jgi:hypothetical protein
MAFDPDAYLGSAPAPSGGFDPDEYLKKKQAEAPLGTGYFGRKYAEEMNDPYSARSTIGRVATGIVGGIPDLAIKFQNAGLNPLDYIGKGVDYVLGTETPTAKLPEITPLLRQATGTPELPEDASTARGFLEGAAQVAGSGGARAVGTAIQNAPTAAAAVLPAAQAAGRYVAAPVIGSTIGANVGEAIGGEKGQLIGSVIGGGLPSVKPSLMVERYYGRHARPDAPNIAAAAERQGIEPTAGMLGNERIQDLERSIAGRSTGPLPNPVINARERTLVQMREAADQAATARGAQHPSPTPGTIGENVLTTAEQTVEGLRGQSSAAQGGLLSRVGPDAPVNVAGTYAALQAEIARTSPDVAAPMNARLSALEQMMPRDQAGRVITGPNGEINIPYERMKDWRGNLGKNTQTQQGISSGHLKQIYGPITDAMREAAVRRGVPAADFDAVMGVTRELTGSGGPVKYFEGIAGKEGTAGRVGGLPPERAFNRVVDEQNPAGLQRLEQHAPGALDRIAGDTLRLRSQETLGQGGTGGTGAPIEGIRGGGAAGARRFANWWDTMSPEAQRILGGNQAPAMADISQAAGAYNYPTRQTGLTRAMGGQASGLATRFGAAGILGEGARAIGLPKALGWAAGMYGVAPALNSIHGAILQSGAARRGLSGRYSAHPTPSIADVLSQLTAAASANRRNDQYD